MFDIQTSPSHWTAERHFSQGVLGEPAVCPPNTNSEPSWDEKDGERHGRMEVCREGKNVQCQQHTRQLWPTGGIHAAHRESVQTLLTCYRQVLSRSQGMLEIGL